MRRFISFDDEANPASGSGNRANESPESTMSTPDPFLMIERALENYNVFKSSTEQLAAPLECVPIHLRLFIQRLTTVSDAAQNCLVRNRTLLHPIVRVRHATSWRLRRRKSASFVRRSFRYGPASQPHQSPMRATILRRHV